VKILHCIASIDFSHSSGLGATAYGLHCDMLSLGASSSLWCAEGAGELVHVSPMPFFTPFYFSAGHIIRLREPIESADVIHLHGLYTHFNKIVGDLCVEMEKPLVIHPQGTLAPWYLRRRKWLKKLVCRWFEDRNFSYASAIRATSQSEEYHILEQYPGCRVEVIPNGIRTDEYPRSPAWKDKAYFHLLDPRKKWLLHMCRMSPVKGTDCLIEAWLEMEEFHQEWQLVLAGSDHEGIGERFPLDAVPRQPYVYLGVVRDEKKLRLLSCASLFVMPSLAEGFPLAALEALAMENAVLLGDGSNFPEVLPKGVGWITEVSREAIKDSLQSILSLPEKELIEKGKMGRCLVEEEFGADLVARRHLELSTRVSGIS